MGRTSSAPGRNLGELRVRRRMTWTRRLWRVVTYRLGSCWFGRVSGPRCRTIYVEEPHESSCHLVEAPTIPRLLDGHAAHYQLSTYLLTCRSRRRQLTTRRTINRVDWNWLVFVENLEKGSFWQVEFPDGGLECLTLLDLLTKGGRRTRKSRSIIFDTVFRVEGVFETKSEASAYTFWSIKLENRWSYQGKKDKMRLKAC